jgi:hypothetical protein
MVLRPRRGDRTHSTTNIDGKGPDPPVESAMASSRTALPGALLVLCAIGAAPLSAQKATDFAGSWTLNRQLSQFPKEVGFSAPFLDTRGSAAAARIHAESAEDAQRVTLLTDEVRVPHDQLAIAVTPADVTLTPDRAPARTFHPARRGETVSLGRVTAVATTSWEEGRLIIVYTAGPGRMLRYTYSLNQNPKQLIVDVEFIERGGGDKVRRLYEPTAASDPLNPQSTSTRSATDSPAASASAPSSPASAPALDQRPDASLKGLTRLGLVLEGFSAASVRCGLKQEALDTTVAKRLADAGLRVVRNSDDDTYLYVNVNTVTASDGLCVSRYDVTLYSQTASKLSYTASPVLLQVELLHAGGLTGGAPAAHADGVMKGVLEYVDQFSARIRAANQ